MKRKTKGRKLFTALTCLVLAAALAAGIWFAAGSGSKTPVNVFPFQYIGMTEYWGDARESYGFVQAEGVQTVYLSTTQTVTQVLVQQGDAVKKGDLLMTFDTTLSDLALERKRLEVEKTKLQLEDAKKRLREINAMRPMVIPKPSDEPEEEKDLGEALTQAYRISQNSDYDGSTPEKALICWLHSDAGIDDELLERLRLAAEDYQIRNTPEEAPTEEPTQETTGADGLLLNQEDSTEPTEETTEPTEEPTEPSEEPTEPSEEPTEPTEEPTEPSEEPTEPTEEPTEPTEEPTEPSEEPTEPSEEPTEPTEEPTEPSGEPTEPSEEPTEPTEEPTEPEAPGVTAYYVVIKVTEENRALGTRAAWQGLYVTYDPETGDYGFRFFDASVVPDHTLSPDQAAPETPEIDYGSGFTAAQIAQMRAEQEKTIKNLEFSIKMAEANYKIAQTEVGDGNVYAQLDGVVVSLLTPEEALLSQQPMLKISAGGGFYVEGTISEMDRDTLVIGQEVTVNDWSTGMVYTGHVESLGDYPSSQSNWNGIGNPTTSYYPFRVFVDAQADLQSGSYVSIQLTGATTENGAYLENPFIRTEGGRSYVYVRDAQGLLEKRYVTTGKSLWGSYTQILEGVGPEDFLAFPYGKDIKVGAPTQESDLNALYE